MHIIALGQIYNEGLFIQRALDWIYPLVDKIILTEGCLSPFGQQPKHSVDDTVELVKEWIAKHDHKNKINFLPSFDDGIPPNREEFEGRNKNMMLKIANPEPGDLIYIFDVDEFWEPSRFIRICDLFRMNDSLLHVPVEEWQLAYGTKLAFKASHDGRFMRYKKGSKFGATNHFFVDGKDVTKDYSHLQTRDATNMMHLCWSKHPVFVREKCLSYKRPSLESWFNWVYLEFPFSSDNAYNNNSCITPYNGTGFAEGQHEKLEEFTGILPPAIRHLSVDWMDYIKQNHDMLLIRK